MEDQNIIEQIQSGLEAIRPYLQKDGGDIEFLELTDDQIIRVRLLGSCITCPMSFMTMKAGVEETLRKVLPTLKRVEAVNVDTNPQGRQHSK